MKKQEAPDMTLESFMTEFKESFMRQYPELSEKYAYKEEMVTKSGKKLHGFILKRNDARVAPVFYYEDFFEMYKNGTPMDESQRKVFEFLTGHAMPGDDVGKMLSCWDKVREKLVVKLLNYENNKEFLERTPHRLFGDMALICQVFISGDGFGCGTVTVDEELISYWDVSQDEVFKAALENMMSYHVKFVDLFKETSTDKEAFADAPRMYLSLFDAPIHGAATMLRTDELWTFAREKSCDLFVVPVSIHEALLMEFREDLDSEFLGDMLRSINQDHAEKADILSNDVFLLRRENHSLINVKDNHEVCIVG